MYPFVAIYMSLKQNAKILVVDDDEDLARTFQTILNKEGFGVVLAFSGGEAIQKLRETPFDLVILDIKLPDMLGDKVVRDLRLRDADLPVVMITGHPEFQSCIDLLDLGVYEVILKPVHPREIIKTSRDAISTRRTKKFWAGKKLRTRKAVTEYRAQAEKGIPVTMHQVSVKYGLSPGIATIQNNLSKLRKATR